MEFGSSRDHINELEFVNTYLVKRLQPTKDRIHSNRAGFMIPLSFKTIHILLILRYLIH